MSGSYVKQHVSPRLRNKENTINDVPACILLNRDCISLSSTSALYLPTTTPLMLTTTGSGTSLRLEAASAASYWSSNMDSLSWLKSSVLRPRLLIIEILLRTSRL